MRTITKSLIYLQAAAILLTAALAASGENGRPFKGSFDAIETSQVQFPTLSVEGDAAGQATHLGRFTFSYEATVNLVNSSAIGTAEFIAANGDTLFAEFTGQGHPSGTTSFIVETFTITGGTGRFAGATGILIGERLLDRVSGVSVGSLDGTIRY